jgi:hypothetical protein
VASKLCGCIDLTDQRTCSGLLVGLQQFLQELQVAPYRRQILSSLIDDLANVDLFLSVLAQVLGDMSALSVSKDPSEHKIWTAYQ